MTASLPSKVAVVDLGYVGLPLATAFSKVLPTIGFDINQNRIAELKEGLDRNGEVSKPDLAAAPLELTADAAQLRRRLPIRSVEMKDRRGRVGGAARDLPRHTRGSLHRIAGKP